MIRREEVETRNEIISRSQDRAWATVEQSCFRRPHMKKVGPV
jgi:hypothetical protein